MMDKWKIQLVFVTFCALVQTYTALSEDEGRDFHEDWQENSVEAGLTFPVGGLMKRAKALRFYGLMGKRSGTSLALTEEKKPFQVKRRNKGEMFVGLMGRSISNDNFLTRVDPSEITSAPDVLEQPHEQGSSEEWVQILY